jgi:hypothetical protein
MAAISGDRGCSMKLLSKAFGKKNDDCGACQTCPLSPMRIQQKEYRQRFGESQEMWTNM